KVFITGNSFPLALPETCIKASTSDRGVCPSAGCGAQWERIVEPGPEYAKLLGKDWADYGKDAVEGRGHAVSGQRPTKRGHDSVSADYRTVGWRPTCVHYDAQYRTEFPQ